MIICTNLLERSVCLLFTCIPLLTVIRWVIIRCLLQLGRVYPFQDNEAADQEKQ